MTTIPHRGHHRPGHGHPHDRAPGRPPATTSWSCGTPCTRRRALARRRSATWRARRTSSPGDPVPEIDALLPHLADGAARAAGERGGVLVIAVGYHRVPGRRRPLARRAPRTSRSWTLPVSGGEAGAVRADCPGGGGEARRPWPSRCWPRAGRPVHLGPLGAGQVAKACDRLIARRSWPSRRRPVVAERGAGPGRRLLGADAGSAGCRGHGGQDPKLVAHDYAVSARAAFVQGRLRLPRRRPRHRHRLRPGRAPARRRQHLVDAGLGGQELGGVARRRGWPSAGDRRDAAAPPPESSGTARTVPEDQIRPAHLLDAGRRAGPDRGRTVSNPEKNPQPTVCRPEPAPARGGLRSRVVVAEREDSRGRSSNPGTCPSGGPRGMTVRRTLPAEGPLADRRLVLP
ncbi:hypothetical protein QJS66_15130 [Kocuria rhizophila]|nr:hypothetical protein QJS66_15130 [Kocuria rhizophila]